MAGFMNMMKSLVGINTEKLYLDFREQQDAPRHHLYQLENGTQFYLERAETETNWNAPKRLYVKWRGKEIDVMLPGNDLSDLKIDLHGNSIYLFNEKRIYRVDFEPATGVTLTFVRSQLEDEEVHTKFNVLCSRIRDGKQYVYRLCDDPETDGIHNNVFDEEKATVKDCELFCIHKTILYYVYNKPTRWDVKDFIFKARFLGFRIVKLVVGDAPWTCKPFCQDSSPFIYMANFMKVQVLNTETMKFLQEIEAPKDGWFTSASVYGRKIYAIWFNFGQNTRSRVMIAKLPRGYYDDETTVNEIQDAIRSENQIFAHEYGTSTSDPNGFSSKFFKEFTVTKIRGEGGFGCVSQVVNDIDHGEYAIKRIAVQSNKLEKALKEVRAMAKLDHPGIVRYNATWIENPPEGWQHEADLEILKKMGLRRRCLMNFNEDSVFIYIQMQLCNYSLYDWLDENQSPSSRSLPRMKMWFKQLVSAVDYIHSKNLIHRDLKPSNILFVETDVLKLCDLGIATERNNDEAINSTIDRSLQGTSLYMSPEQRSLLPYSSKSDVFTLGLILAELLVVMTAPERSQIFDEYRKGTQHKIITDGIAKNYLKKLTQVKPELRPSCKEMLDDLFLA